MITIPTDEQIERAREIVYPLIDNGICRSMRGPLVENIAQAIADAVIEERHKLTSEFADTINRNADAPQPLALPVNEWQETP